MPLVSKSTVAITVAATAAFFGMRALPDSACGFLHAEDKPIISDGIEFCAPNEVGMFADPVALKFAVTAEAEPAEPLAAGRATRVRVRLIGPGGRTLTPHEIAISHTQKVHLLAVDPAQNVYRHLHPQADAGKGDWYFEYTPASGGEHVFFVDCVHALSRRSQVARFTLPVSGNAARRAADAPLATLDSRGVAVSLAMTPAVARAGEDVTLDLTLGGEGAPVRLAPVMGAYAHMVTFDATLAAVAHLHPIQTGREKEARPVIRFRFRAENPGLYRLWAQYDAGLGETFTPFDMRVN